MSHSICLKCSKKFLNDAFLETHMVTEHYNHDPSPRQKGWSTPYGFADFREPVTYQEACRSMKEMQELLKQKGGA